MSFPHISTSWLVCPNQNSAARLRLFCFPCAGGMISAYTRWAKLLPSDIEVHVVHLPGRGKRFEEPLFLRLTDLLPVLAEAMMPYLDIPFAFLGHSMGAVLCFELARYLRKEKANFPLHLICCSCPAPQTPIATPHIHTLDQKEFLAELNLRYNAIPSHIQNDPDILGLFLPSLRGDFTILENYEYTPDLPLNCPISVYSGLQDKAISDSDLAGWCDQTSKDFELIMFKGDHFFLHNPSQALVDRLTHTLKNLSSAKESMLGTFV